jgi:hypothetical protein
MQSLGSTISHLPWQIVAPVIFGTCAMGVGWVFWLKNRRGVKLSLDDYLSWSLAGVCLALFELGMIYGEHNQICPLEITHGFQCSGTSSIVFF